MVLEFNSDGSLKIPDKLKKELKDISKEIPPHYKVLKLVNELNFPVGRKLLAEILRAENTARIKKLRLDNLINYGALDLYGSEDIYDLLERMILSGLIEISKLSKSKYMPVVVLTKKGITELENPSEGTKVLDSFSSCLENTTEITDDDKKLFSEFDFFLNAYNDFQKKAIIDSAKKLLCVAGAGSGKTTVLTKRIEYLIRFKGVQSSEILAITFTRKAKQEMTHRLDSLIPGNAVKIETFNSFCEKLLKKNQNIFYDKEYNVMTFKLKVRSVLMTLTELGYTPDSALRLYYGEKKFARENKRQLFYTFVGDIFSLMDHYIQNEKPFSHMRDIVVRNQNSSDRKIGYFMLELIENISEFKTKYGLRDYTDQLSHAIKLFRKHQKLIPTYSHILVDEYQDVNDIQVKLLDLLNPENLFVVGDPRQSIYGWRGSKVENILNFPVKHQDSSVIQLTTNYRSTNTIVDLGNKVISSLKLPDLESVSKSEEQVMLLSHSDEKSESEFIAQSILSQQIDRKNIFVLARTNRQLENISQVLASHGIKCLKRTIEEKKESIEPNADEVTLSTVHAIKGLEADLVYVIGTNSNMYPCITSDHPFMNIVRLEDNYDKYAEELRLLYVALTRAKTRLIISYFGTLSKFVNKDIQKKLKTISLSKPKVNKQSSLKYSYKVSNKAMKLSDALRDWRYNMSRELNVKPYVLFSNRSMEELVEKKPKDFYELQSVSGFGPTKVTKYGEEIIGIIEQFS